MTDATPVTATTRRLAWPGAGLWNLYFLAVCALDALDYLEIKPLENALLLLWVMVPLTPPILKGLRTFVAVIAGTALLWSESWLPGPDAILQNLDNLKHFTPAYLAELALDFVNPTMLIVALLGLLLWVALREWVRFTTLSILALVVTAYPGLVASIVNLYQNSPTVTVRTTIVQATAPSTQVDTATPQPPQKEVASEAVLNAWYQRFLETEAKRQTVFKASADDAQRFDIAVLNICSLSSDDLEAASLNTHPVFARFDVKFDAFNSATAYSGPATLRLVNGACGQPSHTKLYQGQPQACHWMTTLEKAGWQSQLVMDHNGAFDHYLQNLRTVGGLSAPLMNQANLGTQYEAFDGSPIYRTRDVFNTWLKARNTSTQSTVSLFNLIALHDGNRQPGHSKSLDFKPRASQLLDDLDHFITQLETTGRPVMLIVVPEHGAAVRGDKVQMARLREIPSPKITHVPVFVKFVGLKDVGAQRTISAPTSYLALTELMARTIDSGLYRTPETNVEATIERITTDLPTTWAVSENSGALILPYQQNVWIKLKNGRWLKYRQ